MQENDSQGIQARNFDDRTAFSFPFCAVCARNGVDTKPATTRPMLRHIVPTINGERACRPIRRDSFQPSTAEMIDVLPSVNGACEPIRLIAITVPRIAERVTVQNGANRIRVGFDRFGEHFQRDAVVVHAPAYPDDQTLTRIPVKVELHLSFSLFHNVVVSRLVLLALDKQKASLNNAKPMCDSNRLSAIRYTMTFPIRVELHREIMPNKSRILESSPAIGSMGSKGIDVSPTIRGALLRMGGNSSIQFLLLAETAIHFFPPSRVIHSRTDETNDSRSKATIAANKGVALSGKVPPVSG